MKRCRVINALAAGLMGVMLAAVSAQPAPAAPADVRVDLRILLVSDGGPATNAIATALAAQGVPYDRVALSDPDRPTIDAAFLADRVDDNGTPVERARYQAVVLPNADPFGNAAELAALHDYERRYGIRQINAYVWPTAQVGLGVPDYSGPLDGATAAATSHGLGTFRYLRGAVPFDDNDPTVAESYGFLAQPALTNGQDRFTPLVTAIAPDGTTSGVLIGEYVTDGREQLVMAFSYTTTQLQFRLLAPGIIDWATRGVHLGQHRNHLSVHVDDVFLPDARWSVTGNCTPGEDCTGGEQTPGIRMTAEDVTHAVRWQQQHGFTFDLVYNAIGSVEASNEASAGTDELTVALLQQRAQFRWVNHTYGHPFLGCQQDFTVLPWRCATNPTTGRIRYVSRASIDSEIRQNLAWAVDNDLPIDRTELVTGEHSGLRILPQQPVDNPGLGPALTATDVAWLAADASRMPQQVKIGSALTVPRHPLNVFFNVATAAEEVDEYNWIYTARADGGSGLCEDNPRTMTCVTPLDPDTGYAQRIVPLETRLAFGRILGNDPRPHFVHQSNLAEERLIYPLLEHLLGTYRMLLADNTPLVIPRMSAAGITLRRQNAWRDAVAAGTVAGYVRDGVVTVTAPAGVDIPLTVPEGSRVGTDGTLYGEAYAGARSAWSNPAGAASLVVTLPMVTQP